MFSGGQRCQGDSIVRGTALSGRQRCQVDSVVRETALSGGQRCQGDSVVRWTALSGGQRWQGTVGTDSLFLSSFLVLLFIVICCVKDYRCS